MMLANALALGAVRQVRGGSYSAEAEALFARFTTPPTTERKGRINDLIVALKDGGVWSKLDILWLIGANSQASTRNWVQDAFNLTPVNSPSFTADRRFNSDGSTSYLSTGFNLATATGRKFALESGSLGVWCTTDGQSGTVDAGTDNTIVMPRNLSDTTLVRVNSTNNTSMATASAIGMTQVSRTDSTTQRARNTAGTISGASVPTMAGTDNVALRFLGRGGSTIQYAPHGQAGGYIGSGMTDADMDLIAETFQTYLTAIGAYTP